MKQPILIAAVLTIAAITTNYALADGKALYEAQCQKCHGADGKGETKMGQKMGAKDYTLAKTWEGLTDEKAIKAVKEGVKDKEGKVLMKPSEGTDAEAKAVMEHMKTFKK